jgi:nucleoid DNA-binding protein
LNPLKPKLILDKTSEETGFPINIVKTVVDAYYAELHKKMSRVEGVNININGLGTVSVKRKALTRKIEDTEKMVGHLEAKRNGSPKSEIIYADKISDLEVLRNAFGMLEEEREARAKVREAKTLYYGSETTTL